MNRICNFLTGASLGAVTTYFLDPVVGNRRRALVRDQFNHIFHKLGDAADVTRRDLQNRAYGLVAELRGCITGDEADDEIITQRVRSKMGRYVSHSSAIEVSARNGIVRIGGPILAHEVDDLICAVKSVRGVRGVEDHLEVHESAEDISALQGGVPRTGEPAEWMQQNWSPTARFLAGLGGSLLMLNCCTRRTPGAAIMGIAGSALTLRALANRGIHELMPAGTMEANQAKPPHMQSGFERGGPPPEVQELHEEFRQPTAT
jgi:BON domain